MTMDRGEALFEPSHPFGALIRARRLPCCTMTAVWLTILDEDRELVVAPDLLSISHAARACKLAMGPQWWADSQVMDAARPWSALDAAIKLGGCIIAPRLVTSTVSAPAMVPGRWHLVQRWTGLHASAQVVFDPGGDPVSRGHTYLVRANAGGRVMVYQSSETMGFRATAGSWRGTWGLAGCTVGVAILPAMVPIGRGHVQPRCGSGS